MAIPSWCPAEMRQKCAALPCCLPGATETLQASRTAPWRTYRRDLVPSSYRLSALPVKATASRRHLVPGRSMPRPPGLLPDTFPHATSLATGTAASGLEGELGRARRDDAVPVAIAAPRPTCGVA
jgi:hypothetical protein